MSRAVVAGLFVGGEARRMGGGAKGLLRAPTGETILERSCAIFRSLDLPVVLVGAHDAYAGLPLETLGDSPPGIGPLGGLVALLRRAAPGRAVALASDMPFVSRSLIERMLAIAGGPIVAPRREGRWEPLCAVYDAASVLPMAERRAQTRRHSLQGLLDDAGVVELPLSERDVLELRDWDTPADVAAS